MLSEDHTRRDPVYIHTELRRLGGTLQLLHLEHLEQQHPTGLRYTGAPPNANERTKRSLSDVRRFRLPAE